MCCMLSTFHVPSCGKMGHPFSFLNSSWGLTGENITRKLLSLSLGLFFRILLFQVPFCISFSVAVFSLYFLLVGLLLQWLYFSPGNYVRFSCIVIGCRVAVSNDKSTKWVPPLFCVSFLISFFFKLFVACWLCVIYVREDNDSSV